MGKEGEEGGGIYVVSALKMIRVCLLSEAFENTLQLNSINGKSGLR